MEDEDLPLEDLLDWECLDFKHTSGSSGEQLNLRECPECGKDKWKVYANCESGRGNCFSCDFKFNVFSFTRSLLKSRGGSPSNRDVGLYIADVKRKLGYRPKAKKVIQVAVEQGDVVLPFSAALPFSNGNHPYLESRGIPGEWAQRFHLRISVFGDHAYKNEKGEDVRQNFSNRIIIPVYDLNGDLKTFQGRDITGLSDVRYKFAGGLPGTGRYLYNGHTAYALRSKRLMMVEGPSDTWKAQIALSQYPQTEGVTVVGSFGMHLTKAKEGDDQVQSFQKLRQRGLEHVCIMWDGEPKAYEAALEAAALITSIGLSVSIATLPAGQDPGEADAIVVRDAYLNATPFTRLTALRMKMRNPYKDSL